MLSTRRRAQTGERNVEVLPRAICLLGMRVIPLAMLLALTARVRDPSGSLSPELDFAMLLMVLFAAASMAVSYSHLPEKWVMLPSVLLGMMLIGRLDAIGASARAWFPWTLDEAELAGLRLNAKDVVNQPLTRASLHKANLAGARLTELNLSNANLTLAEADDVQLLGIQMLEARLSYSELKRARVFKTDLQYTTLRYANLGESLIINSNLAGANLSNANLNGTTFVGIDLTQARGLTQSQLNEACGDSSTIVERHLKLPRCDALKLEKARTEFKRFAQTISMAPRR